MRRVFLYLVFAVALARGVGAGDFTRDIPNATWEPIFFDSINRLTDQAGWTRLRYAALPPESSEVRVWIGFGLSPLQGFSIRRDGDSWRGRMAVERIGTSAVPEVREVKPKSGWEKLWDEVTNLGILTLPDSSTLPDEALVLDGESYVVEINQNNHYRTYMYGNPEDQKWPQAKQIIRIMETLSDELTPK
jgi:hypothetical protein